MTTPENTRGEKPLIAVFNATAARYQKTFPEKLANLLITLDSVQIYASPEIAAPLAKNTLQLYRALAARERLMRDMNFGAAAGMQTVGGIRLRHLSLREEGNPRYVSERFPQEMNKIAELDHEMAHFIVPEAGIDTAAAHAAECAADAFAALRHIQRFGTETDFFSYAPMNVAKSVIFGDKIHYVSPVFQKLGRLQKEGKINIAALSLQDTAKLAGEIGAQYAFDQAVLDKIHAAYAAAPAVQNSSQFSKVEAKAIMQVMLRHKDDADIYRAGKLYIGQPAVQKAIIDGLAADPELKDMRAEMERHEKDSGFSIDAAAVMDQARAAQEDKAHAAGRAAFKAPPPAANDSPP